MIKDAIVIRFKELCNTKGISYTELARRSGVTPSTVYSMVQPERRKLDVSTVKKLCDGLEISLSDFFDTEVFQTLEQEIK